MGTTDYAGDPFDTDRRLTTTPPDTHNKKIYLTLVYLPPKQVSERMLKEVA